MKGEGGNRRLVVARGAVNRRRKVVGNFITLSSPHRHETLSSRRTLSTQHDGGRYPIRLHAFFFEERQIEEVILKD
jgi:hypothetical protein